jgi:peptide chain release factor subunit 1
MATQHFITSDRPNVSGLVLAGSADFKTELGQSDMFDARLQAVVLGVVDVSYGGQLQLAAAAAAAAATWGSAGAGC